MTSIRAHIRARLVAGVGSRNIDALRETGALLILAAGNLPGRRSDFRCVTWPLDETVATPSVRRLLLYAGEALPPGAAASWVAALRAVYPRAKRIELAYAGALDGRSLEALSEFLACSGANTAVRYLLDDRAFPRQPSVETGVSAMAELGSARVSVVAGVRPRQIKRADCLLDLAGARRVAVYLSPAPELLALAQLEGHEAERYDAQLLFFRAGRETTDYGYRYACTRVRAALAGNAEYGVGATCAGVPRDVAWLLAEPPRPAFGEVRRHFSGEFVRRIRFRCHSLVRRARRVTRVEQPRSGRANSRVLIVGWYGTETVGDKAILASLLARLRDRPNPPAEIRLASFYPFVTDNTLRELGIGKGDVAVVETYGKEFCAACVSSDEIILGGGPLMDIEALNHVLYAFMRGARRGAGLRVEGCGIGPLKARVYTEAVGHILRLATTITLRDSAAVQRCRVQFGRPDAARVTDPARDFVLSADVAVAPVAEPVVACFLRDWPGSFTKAYSREELPTLRRNLERGLEEMLADCATRLGAELHLYPMHCFHVGGDDRRFNRALARRLARRFGVNARVISSPATPLEILAAMRTAALAVCMRYHSVVFAEALGAPFLAIDYTCGGKVAGFLQDAGRTECMVDSAQLARGEWTEVASQLLGRRYGPAG